jgi:transcriptional regulator with XRE-family HTH domain
MSVGTLLRDWRHRRGLSQLDLAIRADTSARHISFVETGRTVPSRHMLLRLAEHLDVPLRERNRLLVAAGYAPVFHERPLDTPELAATRDTLQGVLDGHQPHPAFVLDRRWNLLLANRVGSMFLDEVDPRLRVEPVNLMRIGLHPAGLAPLVRNLPQVRAWLLSRLARQVAETGDPELAALHDELVSYAPAGDHPRPDAYAPADPSDVALPIHVTFHGDDLRFYSTITKFGAAFDVTLDEIALEAWLPADAATARALHTYAATT